MKKIVGIFFLIASNFLSSQEKSTYRFAEVDSIGERIEETINLQDKNYINSLFDFDRFVDRFLIKSKKKKINDFNKNFTKGLRKLDLGDILTTEIAGGAFYNYLKFYLDEHRKFHLLFRLYSEDEGINYHDFLLEDTPDGYKIVDMYVYLTGENWSDTFKSLYVGYILELDKPELKKTAKPYYLSFIKLKKAIELNNQGKSEEAYKLYQEIPEEHKKNKTFRMNLVLITQNLSDHIYARAIEDYSKSFPNDPGLYLLMIEKTMAKAKYDECIQHIDSLDNALEGDDFLDLYRANIYYLKNDYENAENYFLNLAENYPSFLDSYDSLLTIYAETKKFDSAIEILEIMVKDFELSKNRLQYTVRENFIDLYDSQQFKDWLDKE